MTRLFLSLFVLFALAACFPKHVDPTLYIYDTEREASESARLQALDIHGRVFHVEPTGSMEPLLHGGDYIVVKLGWPADPKTLVGHVLTYQAQWLPPTSLPVTHRATDCDQWGLLCEGDAVDANHPENKYRVAQSNYIGEVVAIYRVK